LMERSVKATALVRVETRTPNTTLSLIPTVDGNTVRSFSPHGQLSAAQGSSTTVSRSDIRLIQHLDFSAQGSVRSSAYLAISLPLINPPHALPLSPSPGLPRPHSHSLSRGGAARGAGGTPSRSWTARARRWWRTSPRRAWPGWGPSGPPPRRGRGAASAPSRRCRRPCSCSCPARNSSAPSRPWATSPSTR
jgi:hypothetical protein